MIVCPFCGLATESAHETQGACVEALQAEVSRVREIVEKVEKLDSWPDDAPRTGPAPKENGPHS
jgi:hypothetical protein